MSGSHFGVILLRKRSLLQSLHFFSRPLKKKAACLLIRIQSDSFMNTRNRGCVTENSTQHHSHQSHHSDLYWLFGGDKTRKLLKLP